MSTLTATQDTNGVTLHDSAGNQIYYTVDGTDPMDYIVTSDGLAVFSNGELVTTGDVQ